MASFAITDFWKEDFDCGAAVVTVTSTGAGFEPYEIPPRPNLVHKTYQRELSGNIRIDARYKEKFYSPVLKDMEINALFTPSIIKSVSRDLSIQGIINQKLEVQIGFEGNLIVLPPEFNISDIYSIYKLYKNYYYD